MIIYESCTKLQDVYVYVLFLLKLSIKFKRI